MSRPLLAPPPPALKAARWAAGPGRRFAEATVALGAAVLVALAFAKVGTASYQLKLIMLAIGGTLLVRAALQPEFGLALVLTLIPFDIAYLHIGTDNTIIFGVAALLLWRVRPATMPVWMRLGAVMLIAGAFLTTLVARDPSQALLGAMRWLAALTLLGAACSAVRRSDAGERVGTIFAITGVLETIAALAQKSGVTVLVGPEYAAGHIDAFFGYYTVLGGFLAIAAIIVTGEVLDAWQRARTTRAAVMGVALAIILGGVGIVESRGGLLALGAGWALLLLFSVGRGSMVFRVGALIAIIGAAGFLATPAHVRTNFQQRFSQPVGTTGSDKTRFALHKAGKEAALKTPLGLGYGNFREYLQRTNPSSLITIGFFHAHELPIQIALDTGWLGLAGFVLLGLWPIVLALRRLASKGAVSVRGLAAAAALGGFAAQGLYDYLMYEISMLVFFAVLVWLAWFELQRPARPGPPPAGPAAAP